MSDNLRVFGTIKKAVKQLYPGEPKGNLARHLNTLAAMIAGIVQSKSSQLPEMAKKVPDGAKPDSRVKRFTRWLQNEGIEHELYFLPFAKALLGSLATQTLVLVMDGSEVGRGCLTLMISIIYKKRALPLAWIVIQGTKGHFPAETHVALLNEIVEIVPADADVIFVGDGEFDNLDLQAALAIPGWQYVCRTAKNIQVCVDDEWLALEAMALQPGQRELWEQVGFTEAAYGPVNVIGWWECGYQEPIYLVTNMELLDEACHWYRKRTCIETFFSDQKTRGFHLNKSHLKEPTRLARLMMATCLAYIWIVFLGAFAKQTDWHKVIHRTDRCDLSLFQLGLRLLDHFLNEHLPIPILFRMPPSRVAV
jgi:hypothetical protein